MRKSIPVVLNPWSEIPEMFEYNGLSVCVAPGGDSREIVANNFVISR